MEKYQERVVIEKKELDEKISRLDDFLLTPLANGLNKIDLELLVRQREWMFRYSVCLGARIQRW